MVKIIFEDVEEECSFLPQNSGKYPEDQLATCGLGVKGLNWNSVKRDNQYNAYICSDPFY